MQLWATIVIKCVNNDCDKFTVKRNHYYEKRNYTLETKVINQ